MARQSVTRREFITAGSSALSGLVLGVRLAPREIGADRSGTAPPFAPNAIVRVDPDGAVTVIVSRPDMGTNVRTALAMLVAEELGAEWTKVRVEQSDLDE